LLRRGGVWARAASGQNRHRRLVSFRSGFAVPRSVDGQFVPDLRSVNPSAEPRHQSLALCYAPLGARFEHAIDFVAECGQSDNFVVDGDQMRFGYGIDGSAGLIRSTG
jgi:hypothetical protein